MKTADIDLVIIMSDTMLVAVTGVGSGDKYYEGLENFLSAEFRSYDWTFKKGEAPVKQKEVAAAIVKWIKNREKKGKDIKYYLPDATCYIDMNDIDRGGFKSIEDILEELGFVR